MEKEKNLSFGLKWGVIIGLFYVVVIFLRYNQGAKNPLLFALFATVGFLTSLVLLYICAVKRRNASGGYIELKDLFQTLFVTVLILELFYAIFNLIYLRAIDPNFFQKFKESTEVMLEQQGVSQEKIDQQMGKLDQDPAKVVSASTILVNYLSSVAVTGVFALIIGLIVRRRRPPFETGTTVSQNNEV